MSDRPPPPKGPQVWGTVLATYPRRDGAELRVTFDDVSKHSPHPRVVLREWDLGRDGVHWPSRRGVNVHAVEIPSLIRALTTALERSNKPQDARTTSTTSSHRPITSPPPEARIGRPIDDDVPSGYVPRLQRSHPTGD